MTIKRSIKTGMVSPKHIYYKIAKVKNDSTFKKKYGALQYGLNKCLKIFFGQEFQEKNKNKKEKYVWEKINGKKIGQPFRCDNYALINHKNWDHPKHVVVEYNGNHHYQSSFKIDTDNRKKAALSDPSKNTNEKNEPGVKYIIFKVPYYLEFTKDYAKYLFYDCCKEKLGESFYSDIKYEKAIKSMYNVSNENMVTGHGLVYSKETPANYNEQGIERFLKEMNEMSNKYPSIKHQMIHSLKLYIKDAPKGKEHLIVPKKNKKFNEWFSLKPEEKYLNNIFERDKKDYKF